MDLSAFHAQPSLPGCAGKAAAAVESDPSSPAPSPMQTSSPDAPQGLAEPSDQASPHHWSPLASSGGCQQHSGRPSPHSQAAPDLPAAEMVPELQQTASSRPTTAPHLLPAAPHLQGSPSPLPEASASPPPDALQSPSQPAAPVLPAGWSPAAGHLSQPRSPAPAPAQPPGWLPAAADSSHAVLGPDPSPQRRSRMVAASAAHRPCSDALPSPIASPVQQAPRCSPADHADAADVPVDDVMPSMSAAASQQQGTAAGEGVAGAAGQPAAAQLAACQPTTDGILPTASAAPALQQGMTVSAQGAQPGGGVEGSAGAQAQDLGLTAGVPSGGLAVDGAASLPPGTLAPIQSPEQVCPMPRHHSSASLIFAPAQAVLRAGLGYAAIKCACVHIRTSGQWTLSSAVRQLSTHAALSTDAGMTCSGTDTCHRTRQTLYWTTFWCMTGKPAYACPQSFWCRHSTKQV